MPFADMDAASTARNQLKLRKHRLEVGPILIGIGNRAQIVTPSIAGTPVAHYG